MWRRINIIHEALALAVKLCSLFLAINGKLETGSYCYIKTLHYYAHTLRGYVSAEKHCDSIVQRNHDIVNL